MKLLTQPITVGVLLVGIGFNGLLIISNWFGLTFLEATYLSISLLILFGTITAHWLLRENRKGDV